MANLNKVMLIGRLTRDPEARTFPTGGKVANFGFAVNNRRKNQTTGEWEDEPTFVDVKAFNREKGRQLADLVEQYLHKGNLTYVEGHLKLEQWTNKEGQKQSKLVVILDDMQFLTPRQDGGEGGSRAPRAAAVGRPAGGPPQADYGYDEPMPDVGPADVSGGEGDIPF
jgi:single-strand DNA-binding protein